MPKLPKHPDIDALRDELKDMQRRLRALEGQTRAQSTAVGAGGITVNGGAVRVTGTGGQTVDGGGDIAIKDGGSIRVFDAGQLIMDRGTTEWYEHHGLLTGFVGFVDEPGADGQPQPGFAFFRADGSVAFALYDVDANDDNGYHQQLWVWDRKGHPVFLDDWTGEGLAFPHIPLTPGDTRDLTQTPRAVDTNWTSIGFFDGNRMHPDVRLNSFITSAGSPSGNYRVRVTNLYTSVGSDLISPTAMGPGGAFRVDGQFQISASTVPWGELMRVSVDLQLTAGAVGEYWTGKVESVYGTGR